MRFRGSINIVNNFHYDNSFYSKFVTLGNYMSKQNTISNKFILWIAFAEGFAVMGTEILSGKLMAPFYGNSIHTWSIVIMTVLGSLTVGYFLGGHLSTKNYGTKGVLYTLLLSTLLVGCIPGLSMYSFRSTIEMNLVSGAIISSILFIAPAMICLGALSPQLISIITKSVNESGQRTGHIFAIATAGGIISTFLMGFYFIPELGSRNSIYIILTLLMGLFLMYYVINFNIKSIAVGIASIIIIISINSSSIGKEVRSTVKLVYKDEGLQGNMIVLDYQDLQSRVLMVDYISQTKMHFSGRSKWPYIYRMATYTSFKPTGSDVLLCGIGGGNLVNELSLLGFNVDAVDIDERMQFVARKYFNMTNKVNLFIDDARHHINLCDKKYDIIILDLSAGEMVPGNLYTIECFKKIKMLLNVNGVLLIHYVSSLAPKNHSAILSIAKTLTEAGYHTNIMNTNPSKQHVKELIYFASPNKIDLQNQNFRMDPEILAKIKIPLKENIYLTQFDFNDGVLITDNQPILEFLHKNVVTELRQSSRDKFKGLLQSESNLFY
ncbi:MAG: hypothetical protein COC01_04565 [Bacteroidetes bacterium]|nr:MAG: hypothetical protein COC01_04565 [Bacteroidota bacterium]